MLFIMIRIKDDINPSKSVDFALRPCFVAQLSFHIIENFKSADVFGSVAVIMCGFSSCSPTTMVPGGTFSVTFFISPF